MGELIWNPVKPPMQCNEFELRAALVPLLGKRMRFVGTVARYGHKPGWLAPEHTILLLKVKCAGKLVADHVWLTVGKRLQALSLKPVL